jgi:hypothetical protein
MDLFVTRAAILAREVDTADSSRRFRSAVQEFEHLLSRISHYPSDFLTETDAHALASIADRVVDRIVGRLDACADRHGVQRALVQRIYKVRRDVEHIYGVVAHPAEPAAAAPWSHR